MVRVAVLDDEKCESKRCDRVCYRFCPPVRNRIEAIHFEGNKPVVVEQLCVGCGICVKKCPFKALSIINLPDEIEEECSHRFGPNTFKLFRLPMPSPGVVVGLLGQNGIGKTTALKILSGEVKLNLGKYEQPPDWAEIIQHFRGSTLQEYLEKLSAKKLRIVLKPQYVDKLPQAVSGKVVDLLQKVDERDALPTLTEQLQLSGIMDRELSVLSGGELQRVAIAAAMSREADVYLFDEPSSYLDVQQRLQAAKVIRTLKDSSKTVIVAEHDLAILDYLSDQICIFYGCPSVYGIVSHVHSVRTGINIYLEGFVPDENIRFRKEPIIFHAKPPSTGWSSSEILFKWDAMQKSFIDFSLSVEPGEVGLGEVIGILGPNGIGKTTFVKLLAGIEKPDAGSSPTQSQVDVGYKPQYISAEYQGTVDELLKSIAKDEYTSGWYKSEISQPLNLDPLLERDVSQLSGGELQRIAIAACLSKKTHLYLLDEPSAYLDVEERLAMARTIRRVIETRNAAAFVVEHDVVAQDFIADRLVVFTGKPGITGFSHAPTSLRKGMNAFLKNMKVTFRRDPATKRPRVNKEDSKMDRYQKKLNEYYYISPQEP